MNAADHDETGEDFDAPVDPRVTPKLFRKWRAPRFGGANPERMNNPAWEWLVSSRLSAYEATQKLNGPSAMDAGPGWCFQRFGQSKTELEDGRIVLIAGEHEDSYDPDFHIYNDVVVRHPDGCLDIFGYPREVFPPTDFHTATRVGNRLILIGNLGYWQERKPGETQVLSLDLNTFAVEVVATSGAMPGWIHKHTAALSEDGKSIMVQDGLLDRCREGESLVENLDEWRLSLVDWSWKRLTHCRWRRFDVRRKDGERNHLFDFKQALWKQEIAGYAEACDAVSKEWREKFEIPTLEEDLGAPPDLDLFQRLYKPGILHEDLPEHEGEFGVHRIRVEGVVVRYVSDMHRVTVTVEGDLPGETINALTRDLTDKLAALEHSACELVEIDN